MNNTPAISVKHVCFNFGSSEILHNLHFQIPQGQCVGIIGPNGGGKTTLLRLILGLLKPSRGTIQIFGEPPNQEEGLVAYVPQSLHYDRSFPISTLELVLGGRLSYLPWYGFFKAADRERAMEALAEVGLQKHAHAPFGSLSGGQRQRVLIARALAGDPKIILLDEPTANVDSEAEEAIYQLLHRLKGKKTILMVTHNLRSILQLVDVMFSVEKTVEQMLPSEVCEHFALGLYHHPLKESECTLQIGKSRRCEKHE